VVNEELIEKLKGLHERLKSHGISEDNYHLLGLFGSSSDDEKISLNIKRGEYTIVFETYYKERGEKHSVTEFNDIDEACDYIFKKAIDAKTLNESLKKK
jgi:hypothetical protein